MLEYHNILVGLDGSDLADRAFEQAIAIAKRNQAKLFIAQIIPDNLYVNDNMTFPVASVDAEKKSVKQYLEQKVAFAKEQGVSEVQLILKTGSARRELALTIPAEFNIDLTVLGISGKGAIERLLIGSVAQFVSVHSVSNVLLIKS